jgi:hypothetical protein
MPFRLLIVSLFVCSHVFISFSFLKYTLRSHRYLFFAVEAVSASLFLLRETLTTKTAGQPVETESATMSSGLDKQNGHIVSPS